MLDAPTVSLLMAAYETSEARLRVAVESALAQRGCSFELIVVDDGSPKPVATSLAQVDDPRLTVLRTEHGGESAARNAGIRAARGEFIRFIDSDDYFPADSTAELLGLMDSATGIAIAAGATRFCRPDLTPILDLPVGCPRLGTLAHLLKRCNPLHHSMMFPRTVVDAAGPWDPRLKLAADWDFVLRAMEHAPVTQTRQVMTWYRQHEQSISRNVTEAWRGSQLVVEGYFQRHPEERGGPIERKAAAMLDYVSAELRRPSSPWMVSTFWRAVRRDPGIVHTLLARQGLPRVQRLRWRAGLRRRKGSEPRAADGSRAT